MLVLIGPPGAGKSTIGRLVAERRGVGFRDTDADVEALTGTSIVDLFVSDGEPAFRRWEREAVARALREHDGVLAVGGGAPLDPDTREQLASHLVVFLDVGLAAAVERTGLNQSRPLLAVNPRATLKAMLDERRPVYQQVASATVVTDGRTLADVLADVEALL